MSSIKRNLGYQTILQILNTCLPLITSPYLSRTLLAEGLGIFSYSQSVVNYFTLIAMLGVINYGTREIASCKDDRNKRNEKFWNIYALQCVMALFSILIYFIYIKNFVNDHLLVAWIQGLYVISTFFDVSWLYFGVEDFVSTVKVSMIIRIASVFAIIFFVNNPKDLSIYTLIMSGGVLLSNFLLWLRISNIIDIKGIKQIKLNKIYGHIKPNFSLFIPLLAMSFYHLMDKTMLGTLSTYEQTGFYYNADKIINIPMGIITGIGTVMLPRITSIVSSENSDSANKLFLFSVEMIAILAIAMSLGIAAIADKFVPFFFGYGFDPCINLITVLAPVLIAKAFSYTARMQYLIPNYKESIFVESVLLGALLNLSINILLIPKLGALGAVLGTLAAEVASCFWQYFRMSKFINCLNCFFKSIIYLFFGLIMFLVLRGISPYLPSSLFGLFIEIVVGVLLYSVLCILYWKYSDSPILYVLFRKN